MTTVDHTLIHQDDARANKASSAAPEHHDHQSRQNPSKRRASIFVYLATLAI
jgi:hypothetical protein